MRILPPKIDPRKANDVLRSLREMAPHYTKEWSAKDDDDPGVALLKIFSSIAEGVISRLNRAPDRNLLAFLDMLGIRLLQAIPAHAHVKFLIADGTESPFLIAKGTQVSAPPTEQHPEDLPFETTENVLAIPATLTSLFAVDPEADRIYKPRPGFLELSLAAPALPELTITAFSAANSRTLQLDPPEQVKPGDFLRIDQEVSQRSGPDQCVPFEEKNETVQREHLVVSEVKGSVVTVTDRLLRDYVDGTKVRRVTQFEMFEARNWQEHNLYLGHSEYFAIKTEAQITLTVVLGAPASTLQPLAVAWEFFGEDEATKEKGWFPLELDGDGTLGFSRSGDVVLTKPEGEIKESEIDGRKNRWIRARLTNPLPSLTSLPKIESIMFTVSHQGDDLEPDAAFNNDTPLTTAAAFLPFGPEPRIFDRFSIASKEAFSKPGAEIILHFKLDETDLLAVPDAIVGGDKIRAFARSVTGKLLEFAIDPRENRIAAATAIQHGNPENSTVAAKSKPAVVLNASKDHVGVFVKAEDGKIHVRSIVGANPGSWHPLLATSATLQFDPAAILSGTTWRVFVVADDGRLYSQNLNPAGLTFGNSWTASLGGPTITSTPFLLDVTGQVYVFVSDDNGHVWSYDGTTWTDETTLSNAPIPSFLAAKNARPFALPYIFGGVQRFRIFFANRAGELVEIDTGNGNISYGSPPGTTVGSNPFALKSSLGTDVFVRGNDDRLWSLDPGGSWVPRGRPSGLSVKGDPLALAIPESGEELFSVLSTSDKNSLLEFRLRGEKLDDGDLRAGSLDIVTILDDINAAGITPPLYIRISDGPNANEARKIDMSLSKTTFVVVEDPFDDPVEKDNEYTLLEEKKDQAVVSATATTLELQPGAGALMGDYVLAKDQIRKILSISVNIVTVDPWNGAPPTSAHHYHLLRPVDTPKKVPVDSLLLAVLGASASGTDNDYNRRFLVITDGPGKSPDGLAIEAYFGTTKHVQLSEAFKTGIPTSASDYLVTGTSAPEAWFQIKDPNQEDLRPKLSWEYGNGLGWLALKIQKDGTNKLLHGGDVVFTLPADIAETEVAGQKNFWIRARIVGGDYGKQVFKFDPATQQVTVERDPIRPPEIKSLFISYELTELKAPQIALTFNNLNFLDQTAANETENKNFPPFVSLRDESKTLYFGFDRAFSGAPVKIYFVAKELEVDERNKPKVVWSMSFENNWKELIAEDETEGFTRPDYVTLDVPKDFQNTQQFGKALFWLRASLTEGKWVESPLLSGVFVNTVEALQARTVRDEILGSSTGIKNQKFAFQQTPVIEGEEVRVREALTDEERDQLIDTYGEDVVFIIRDQQDRILETWVRWTEVVEFYDSDSKSRDYRLDRHTGEIEFGDGIHGRMPPVGGDNIRAFSYQAGGGAAGNVTAGEIDTLVTAVAGVDSVINPVAAGGGSDAATNEDMLTVGPAQISHRDRAVTPEDFERLALEASREVRKARCLPNRNANGRHELGWTTIRIVPDSQDAEPVPSLELRRSVQRYLADRADLTLVDQKHIVVGPPKYVTVSIEGQVFAKTIDDVATADQRVKKQLEDFLHPLTGGPESKGWEFGRDLAASDLYSLLESIEEVDHVGPLQLVVGGAQKGEQVSVGADALIAGGTHKITTLVASGD